MRQQRLAVRPDHRIDVDVDHTGVRRDPLGHLVHVGLGREAAAEVEELPDAALAGQVTHHPADERPVVPDDSRYVRRHLQKPLRRLPVDGEIIFAAE